MAYKLLSHILSIDIVKKVLEYNVCSDRIFHIYKIFNVHKIFLYNLYQKENVVKKYNYANLFTSNTFLIVRSLQKHNIIMKYRLDMKIYEYLKNTVKYCSYCTKRHKKYNIICFKCDYSMCKDNEFIKLFEEV